MTRKIPKKAGRQAKKKKFKVQDPYYSGPKKVDTKRNKPPKKDDDVIDRMPSFGGAADAMAGIGDGTSADSPASISKKAERRKRKKAAARAKEIEDWIAGGDGGGRGGAGGDQDSLPALPTRATGESEHTYKKRLRQHLQERQRKARQRQHTNYKREKLRAQEKARRDVKMQKKASKQKAPTCVVPAFGEVVDRPPVMSNDILRSREKLKQKQEVDKKGASALAKVTLSHARPRDEMSDYASKVRDAYAAVKAKRHREV
mmetsp:Transcript_19389/g.45095  ORF Transcript_19389/g.45095 Transcript_19389/m.45095 type:complete len:259 (+) Transcript_19389:60-836(+)